MKNRDAILVFLIISCLMVLASVGFLEIAQAIFL